MEKSRLRAGVRTGWLGMVAWLVMALSMGCASSEAQMSPPGGYGGYGESAQDSVTMSGGAPSAAQREVAKASRPSRAERAPRPGPLAQVNQGAAEKLPPAAADGERVATQQEIKQRQTPLLIYTGQVLLAIYDVEATKDQAVELVEARGGYISQRAADRLTARVPAEIFREMLDELAALGDVVDVNWQAQDVSDQVRDLDIRLMNSLELRDRLQELLELAESVEDALAIEVQLERITLEIERIRGQLRSFEDQIAYSTILLIFRPQRMDRVPDDAFLLPFAWLNHLGLQSLLQAPEEYR